jgi:hypothetical protein
MTKPTSKPPSVNGAYGPHQTGLADQYYRFRRDSGLPVGYFPRREPWSVVLLRYFWILVFCALAVAGVFYVTVELL